MKKVTELRDITNFKKLEIYFVGSGNPADEHDISGIKYYDRIDETKSPPSLYIGIKKFEGMTVDKRIDFKHKQQDTGSV